MLPLPRLFYAAILLLSLCPATATAQYAFSEEYFSNGFFFGRGPDIQRFGDEYLVTAPLAQLSPTRFLEQTSLLPQQGEGEEMWAAFFTTDGARRVSSENLVLNDSVAIVYEVVDNFTNCGYQLFRIDRELEVTASTPFADADTLKPFGLIKGDGEDFFLYEQSFSSSDEILITHFNANLDTLGRLSIRKEGVPSLGAEAVHRTPEGDFLIVYKQFSAINPFLNPDRVMRVDADGVILSDREIPRGVTGNSQSNTVILPVGEDGFAVLSGIDPGGEIACAGSCPMEGDLLSSVSVFSAFGADRVRHELRFYAYGMFLDAEGELVVFGNTLVGSRDNGIVLFRPAGWPQGGRLLRLLPPATTGQGNPRSGIIRRLRLEPDGKLLGVGSLLYDSISGGSGLWYFEFDLAGCLANDCDRLEPLDEELVGVNQRNPPATIKVFPNPATDRLWLTELPHGKTLTVYVIDVAGRRVMQKVVSGPDPGIDVGELPRGVYLLQFADGRRWKPVKFVKR